MKNLLIIVVSLFAFHSYSNAQTNKDEILIFAEQMPEFPGGQEAMMKYFSKNVVYPKKAKENKIEGRVIGKFVVRNDGSIDSVEVLKGVNTEIDAEFVRVVKAMPKWEPGKQNGKNIAVKFTLPMLFKLN